MVDLIKVLILVIKQQNFRSSSNWDSVVFDYAKQAKNDTIYKSFQFQFRKKKIGS